MDNNLGIFQQQLNRVQLYKSTRSIMQDSTYTLNTNWDEATILNIYQSTIGMRPASGATYVCTRSGSLQPTYVRDQSIMKDSSYTLSINWDEATIVNRYQSAIGMWPVGSATRVCMHPTSSTTHVYTGPGSTTTCVYHLSFLGFFASLWTQILCNLQSFFLLFSLSKLTHS